MLSLILQFINSAELNPHISLFELVVDIKQINYKQMLIFLSLIFVSDIEWI